MEAWHNGGMLLCFLVSLTGLCLGLGGRCLEHGRAEDAALLLLGLLTRDTCNTTGSVI